MVLGQGMDIHTFLKLALCNKVELELLNSKLQLLRHMWNKGMLVGQRLTAKIELCRPWDTGVHRFIMITRLEKCSHICSAEAFLLCDVVFLFKSVVVRC